MSSDIDQDFQAEMDMRAVIKAEDIKKNPSRMIAVKNFALSEVERFERIADIFPKTEKKGFNGAVKNSRMNKNAKS